MMGQPGSTVTKVQGGGVSVDTGNGQGDGASDQRNVTPSTVIYQ